MKTFKSALLAGALLGAASAAPVAALAQSHGGFHGGGGFHSSGGGFHGGSGFSGGGFSHGYGGHGYGGYRGYGYGGYRGYGYALGGFGLGLALGAAYDPFYSGYGYGYPYYGYPSYGYGPSDYGYDGDDYGPPPPAAPAVSGQQACGQWVWHADQNKYAWVPGACG